jgi:hypothetical protein
MLVGKCILFGLSTEEPALISKRIATSPTLVRLAGSFTKVIPMCPTQFEASALPRCGVEMNITRLTSGRCRKISRRSRNFLVLWIHRNLFRRFAEMRELDETHSQFLSHSSRNSLKLFSGSGSTSSEIDPLWMSRAGQFTRAWIVVARTWPSTMGGFFQLALASRSIGKGPKG